jgi:hypothetical protein
VIRASLQELVRDASVEQIRAWDDSIPELQREIGEVVSCDASARTYTAILEYELPMESRRPDVILLVRGPVVVLELKGKSVPSQADIDQAAAYARDLRCYHRECADRSVVPVVVPTRARGDLGERSGVRIVGPDALDRLVSDLAEKSHSEPVAPERFLNGDAYRPLPTLVKAARELLRSGQLRTINRARAATDPAMNEITRIVHDAARTSSRRLILLTGVPGSGKTLVGLRVVHAHYLDDLAVPRSDAKPTAPAVFLSGNGPLVQVLQYELRGAGGGGKTFVRGVKDYVKRYSGSPNRVPPEHVLVFDEAQRAFDAEQVQAKHQGALGFEGGKSEPEHFIDFAERVPEWCVVVGLIGEGQEIHVGEEAGLGQWRRAIEGASDPGSWKVHGPPGVDAFFRESSVSFSRSSALNLDVELRFHLARDIHRFVAGILEVCGAATNRAIADALEADGFHVRITRDLSIAKHYLRERYAENTEARFGILASSRDRDLQRYGIANDWNSTKQLRFGPWYGDTEDHPGRRSCRQLDECVTEFGSQGLELDATLLAWGTDLLLDRGVWSNRRARSYRRGSHVRDALKLRLNAYRVLLTRGRDGVVVFVPALTELDETYQYLVASGFCEIRGD